MQEVKNILFVGVGGQGTILASKILTEGLLEAGYDVKMSEVHGMSQRGGSVTTQVRFGKKVYSPIIGQGQADILVAFEEMEALRVLDGLKPQGIAVVNEYKMAPMPVLSGECDYPEGILDEVKSKVKTVSLNAAQIAEDLGNGKCMNVVLFGALVKALKLDDINWENVVRRIVKPAFAELNIQALNAGMNAVQL